MSFSADVQWHCESSKSTPMQNVPYSVFKSQLFAIIIVGFIDTVLLLTGGLINGNLPASEYCLTLSNAIIGISAGNGAKYVLKISEYLHSYFNTR